MGTYVDPSDVPVIGPDPYEQAKKEQMIMYAEAKLEGDVNDGDPIEDPSELHEYAANAYASFILAAGPKAPADVHSGDFADSGDDISDFANDLREMYRSARAAIRSSDDVENARDRIDMGGTR